MQAKSYFINTNIYIMQSTNTGEKQISRMFKAQEPKEKKKVP